MSSIAEECVAHSDSGAGVAKVTAGAGVSHSVTGVGAARVAAALTPCAEPVLHNRDAENFRKAVQRVFSSALISSSLVTRAPWCPKWQRPLRCQDVFFFFDVGVFCFFRRGCFFFDEGVFFFDEGFFFF